MTNSVRTIIAVHQDCSADWSVDIRPAPGAVAIADLDGDRRAEILAVDGFPDGTPIVFDDAGRQLAFGPWAGVAVAAAVANVDGVGSPEIAYHAAAYQYLVGNQGLKLLFDNLWYNDAFLASVIADLDGDGIAEIVVGSRVFDGVTGVERTPTGLAFTRGRPSYPAIADFDGDGSPDLVLVETHRNTVSIGDDNYAVSVFSPRSNSFVFGPYVHELHHGYGGGAPLVDDLDADGVPDIGVAGLVDYCVYSPRCARKPIPADCREEGILWCKPIQDWSGTLGATSFDFDGDGAPEVVFRDECWLRVFDGPSGRVVFARSMTAFTADESPVVVDIDRDGHADLVVSADYFGASPQDAIASYHITEINDDLSVPLKEKPSWIEHNTYRRNQKIGKVDSWREPDFTAAKAIGVDNGSVDCASSFVLWANICNRGTYSVPVGVQGAFYRTDPRIAGTPICVARTSQRLDPGTCSLVSCPWNAPPQGPVDLWFRANDDGLAAPVLNECRAGNDVLFLPGSQCKEIQ
jgi:hypothetical protein